MIRIHHTQLTIQAILWVCEGVVIHTGLYIKVEVISAFIGTQQTRMVTIAAIGMKVILRLQKKQKASSLKLYQHLKALTPIMGFKVTFGTLRKE